MANPERIGLRRRRLPDSGSPRAHGPGGFVVQYDKKAGKLWYLMPFEANIKTDYVEYNVVFQWVG
jgi:hypothetical protein